MSLGHRRGQRIARPGGATRLFLTAVRYGSFPAACALAVFVLRLYLRHQGRMLSDGPVYGPGRSEEFSGPSRHWRGGRSGDGLVDITESMRPYVKSQGGAGRRRTVLLKPRRLEPIFRCRPRRGVDPAARDGGGGGGGLPSPPAPVRHEQKIVFVHVFKTAGSTLREFFADYARRCSAGWAVLIGCTRLHGRSLLGADGGGGKWTARRAGKADGCQMKRSVTRGGADADVAAGAPVFGGRLAESFDMFGGHLPLGTGSVWEDAADEGGRPRGGDGDGRRRLAYVAFFRNAVDKYLSGISFVTQAGRPPKAIEQVKRVVPGKLAGAHFQSKFGDYLITPQQRMADLAEGRGAALSSEEQAVRVMMNLLRFDVLVGVTERMSDSLRQLEALMDGGRDATDIFDKYGRERKGASTGEDADATVGGNSTAAETRKANQSQLSTSDLVKALMEGEPFLFLDVLEYTKYEQQITDFALALHLRQLKSLGLVTDSMR